MRLAVSSKFLVRTKRHVTLHMLATERLGSRWTVCLGDVRAQLVVFRELDATFFDCALSSHARKDRYEILQLGRLTAKGLIPW